MKLMKNIKRCNKKWLFESEEKFPPRHGVLFQAIFCLSSKKLLAWNENWEWKNDERALSEKVKHQRIDWDNKARELKIDISYLKRKIKAIKNEHAMKILMSLNLMRITLFGPKCLHLFYVIQWKLYDILNFFMIIKESEKKFKNHKKMLEWER